MSTIKKLIEGYCTSRDVYTVEKCLDEIIKLTNESNYKDIIIAIEQQEGSNETEAAIYINEIIANNYLDLKSIVQEKRTMYTEAQAIEELEEALTKFN